MAKKQQVSKKAIIITVIILSIVMYLAGVFSGLFANKIVEEQVTQDLDFLRGYVDTASLDLKNLVLLQFFMENIDRQCDFREAYLNQLSGQLEPFWNRLPVRLESYEQEHKELSPEYISLKREYLRLSLRIWLLAQQSKEQCGDTTFIPILYFYSRDCDSCVEQGEAFDSYKASMAEKGKDVVVFSVDAAFEDDTLFLLKTYYNITDVPAVVIGDTAYQGDVLSAARIRALVR